MNPRDTTLAILTDVNIHRIIRRSTTYGAPYDPDAISPHDDETPHGLYFIFLSAKAAATLEFLQQEWINNGNISQVVPGGPVQWPDNGRTVTSGLLFENRVSRCAGSARYLFGW